MSETKVIPDFGVPTDKGGLVVHQPNPYDNAVTPMELIQLAMNQNADISKLEKLMELQLRWEANEAKKAFVSAMNAFKADPPDIIKNKKVAYKDVAYKYATLANVCDQVTGALSKHGISHRWRTEQSDGLIRVTCILTHDRGHSEETTLSGAPDDTGSKNKIQAIGSTVKYLERYTLLAATGLEAGDEDNDGQGAEKWEKLQEFLDAISTAPNMNVLQRDFKAGFSQAAGLMNTAAMKMLVAAKDERIKQLRKEEGQNEQTAT
jgi:hypothetical protein